MKWFFADTLIEDEDLYRFLDDIEVALDKKIIRVSDGRTPWEVFVDKKYIGNTRIAHCSQVLKTEQIKNWLSKNSKISDPLVLGMDWSEQDRIERAQKNWAPRPVISLINEFKFWRPHWDKKFEEYNLEKPRLYKQGFPHNNCGGFCVRAGLKQFATLLESNPERFEYHEKEEQKAIQKIGPTARPFLRHTPEGERRYLTLRQFREDYEQGKLKPKPFDYGGCGCFTDD